jgi:hypothetical protein
VRGQPGHPGKITLSGEADGLKTKTVTIRTVTPE